MVVWAKVRGELSHGAERWLSVGGADEVDEVMGVQQMGDLGWPHGADFACGLEGGGGEQTVREAVWKVRPLPLGHSVGVGEEVGAAVVAQAAAEKRRGLLVPARMLSWR